MTNGAQRITRDIPFDELEKIPRMPDDTDGVMMVLEKAFWCWDRERRLWWVGTWQDGKQYRCIVNT